ncbi:hypothetical protein CRYUN_Cryun01aG0158300 [Craigia yunnanensis]
MARGRADANPKKRLVTWIIVLVICFGCFYAYTRSHGSSALEYGSKSLRKFGSSYWRGDEDTADSSAKLDEDGDDGVILKSFPVCDDQHSELIPCLDRHLIYQTRLKLDLSVMEHYERHCPLPERCYNCLIPPPPGYKIPIKWPKSGDEVWKANIPHTHLAKEKSDQNWMIVKGDKIVFPGGGTHFHYGADKKEKERKKKKTPMLNFPNNILNNEGNLRTVFDVGCGVASFGGYLLSSDIISMSLAPNDVHQNQIQFALERGIPAYLGVLRTKRLPYPSRSFELAHCSRCRIDWLQRNGILLLELDRVLRPGGYFAYSSPEAYAQDEEDLRIWRAMSTLVERMCWKIAAKRNQTVIWVKPLTNDCYMQREPGTHPPMCKSDDDPDAVWGVPMDACITPYSSCENKSIKKSIVTLVLLFNERARGSGLAPWPARLTTPPPRLADLGYSDEMFLKDTELWQRRVENYWNLLGQHIESDTVRNLMCESFSIYPRTYDLLHAWTVFSDIERKECSIVDLLIEMDRILRPKGFIIIHDKRSIVELIKKYLGALHWESVATADSQLDSEQDEDNVVFIIQKKMWLTSESLKESE